MSGGLRFWEPGMRWGKLEAPGGRSGSLGGVRGRTLGSLSELFVVLWVIYNKDYEGKAMEFTHCHFGLSPG